jgi:SGNH hydrolase-like domain, acetyltransferase AlgX
MARERLVFIGVFVAMIVAVWIQMLIPFAHTRPLDEYRKPAPAPDIIGIVASGHSVAATINAWFDDRMGFRSFLTRLSNQIDYSIFGYSKNVLIGKDGWLFDRDFFTAGLAASRASDNLDVERKKLASLAEPLERKNIRLVVVSTPAKETVYRELLPVGTPPGPSVSEFEKFRAYLKTRDGQDWIYIDSRDILMGPRATE